MRSIFYICLLGLLVGSEPSSAKLSTEESANTLRIARAIQRVQPNLSSRKVSEYALGIFRASSRFNIDPTTLIAIAQQESSFRENLPEGKAGEIGMCQIRKMWLQNPKFQDEFGKVTVKELAIPANNFLFSAWILNELRGSVATGSLPYWSYYNAVRFENRFKYFLRVNKKLAALQRFGFGQSENFLYREASLGNTSGFWKPKKKFSNEVSNEIGEWKPTRQLAQASSKKKSVPETSLANKKGWIADALFRLWQDEHAKESKSVAPEVRKKLKTTPQKESKQVVMQVAKELGVEPFEVP